MASSTTAANDAAAATAKPSNLIDGKEIAKQIRASIKEKVAEMTTSTVPPPGLAVILVGSRRDSQTYVAMKKKACAAAGIVSVGYDFDDTVTQNELLAAVNKLNDDPTIHGILIQLPLPSHLNQDLILHAVNPSKDVDGLHPANVASLVLYTNRTEATDVHNNGSTSTMMMDYQNAPFSIACTPLGCLELLDRATTELGETLEGKHAVVVGRSQLVGIPMARLLLGRDCTVTMIHSKTKNPAAICATADVVVVAAGKPGLVKSNWIKEGAVVVDVGINSVTVTPTEPGGKDYKLVGDVDFENVALQCRKITPVPGGVGPMTIAMLLQNTLRACQRQQQREQREREQQEQS